MNLIEAFGLESLELVLVYFTFTKGIEYLLNSKHQFIRNKEIVIRLGIMIYFFSLLIGILFTILSNTINLQYILYFERVSQFYTAHVSTDILIPILFFTICTISYLKEKDITKIDTYFASAFTMLMAFTHELIWNSIAFFYYPQVNFTFYLTTESSYIEAIIMLTLLVYKLKSDWFSIKALALTMLVNIPYYIFWVSLGFPITVLELTRGYYIKIEYFQSLIVNQIEVHSWILIFTVFLLNLLVYKPHLVYKAVEPSEVEIEN